MRMPHTIQKHIEIQLLFQHLTGMGIRSGLIMKCLGSNYFMHKDSVSKIVFTKIPERHFSEFDKANATYFFRYVIGLKSVNINNL